MDYSLKSVFAFSLACQRPRPLRIHGVVSAITLAESP